MPNREPVVLIRIVGVTKLSEEERRALARWITRQGIIVDNDSEMGDDYTARCFAFTHKAREPQKESRWKRFRKWVGI